MVREDFIYCRDTGDVYRKKHKDPRKPIGGVQMCGSSQKKPYKKAMIDGKTYYLHRLVWWLIHGDWPEHEIDHIDGDGCNNRIENLRQVTRSENMRNVNRRATNTSGCYGVTWNKKYQKWYTTIKVDQKAIFLGAYSDKGDAIKARKDAEIKYGFHDNHGSML